jgi:hypothetical protein
MQCTSNVTGHLRAMDIVIWARGKGGLIWCVTWQSMIDFDCSLAHAVHLQGAGSAALTSRSFLLVFSECLLRDPFWNGVLPPQKIPCRCDAVPPVVEMGDSESWAARFNVKMTRSDAASAV